MRRALHLVNRGFSEVFLFKGSKVFAFLGGVCLLALMMVTFITVVFRSLPMRSDWLVGGYEFSEMFMAMLTPFAMAYAWYKAGHVRIGLVRDKVPPRVRALIDALSSLLGAVFCFFVAWGVYKLGITSLDIGRATNLRDIPIGPFQFLFIAVMGHFMLVLVRSMIGLFAKAFGSRFANEPYLEGQ
ncbi:MAG: TRAP transporter small permease [Chloroflexota bacterium]